MNVWNELIMALKVDNLKSVVNHFINIDIIIIVIVTASDFKSGIRLKHHITLGRVNFHSDNCHSNRFEFVTLTLTQNTLQLQPFFFLSPYFA